MSSTNGRRPSAPPGAAEYALLAGVSLTWGTSYMFTKIAVSAMPPLTVIATRTVLAALVMSALLFMTRQAKRLGMRDLAALALVGLSVNAAPLCLIAISVSLVDSSVTATTMALVPLITAVYAVFRGEYPTVRNMIGIAVGVVGIVVLFGPQALASLGDSAWGAMAAIAASLIFAGSLFMSSLVRHHHPLLVATYSLAFAAMWTLPVAWLHDGLPAEMPTAHVAVSVLVLSLFNTAAASLLVFALVARTGPIFTSLNNYLVPAVAVVCGTIFLHEPLTLQKVAGAAIVLAGVAISSVRRRPAVPPVPPTA